MPIGQKHITIMLFLDWSIWQILADFKFGNNRYRIKEKNSRHDFSICCFLSFDLAVTILEAPRIERGPQTTFAGIYSSVNLSCVVSGSPQPSVQWFKDNSPLSGQVYPFYFIQSVELDDRGVYHCEGVNSEGSVVSNPAVLNILGIQQYVVELFIPLAGFGVSSFSSDVIQQSRRLVSRVRIE